VLFCLAVSISLMTSCKSSQSLAFEEMRHLQSMRWIKSMNAEDFFDSQVQVAFAKAIETGNTNSMQLLLTQGANVNYRGRDDMRPLFWALAKQNITGFTFLLEHGADPNAVTEHPPMMSVLELSVRMADPQYLEVLLKHGANPNSVIGDTPQTAETAIFSGILYNKLGNIQTLLRYGAEINWKMSDGTTPFHYAILCDAFEAALLLYKSGANPQIENNMGYSPVDLIKKYRDNGVTSRADEKAYKQLIEQLMNHMLLERSDLQ
jgi:ankyrin repeat protein